MVINIYLVNFLHCFETDDFLCLYYLSFLCKTMVIINSSVTNSKSLFVYSQ